MWLWLRNKHSKRGCCDVYIFLTNPWGEMEVPARDCVAIRRAVDSGNLAG